MTLLGSAAQNLLSPVILFFLLGVLAGRVKSTLTIPEPLSKSVSLYLMMAIGFRGGVELGQNGLGASIATACLGAAALGVVLPIIAYAALRLSTRLDRVNAAAIAAHYGSVSVVTFAAAVALLNRQKEHFEPYLVALLAVMEAPAILTGLILARRGTLEPGKPRRILFKTVAHEVLLHGSVVLLLGSVAIGWITGDGGLEELSPVFVAPFKGVLCVFLLDMGLLVAQRMSDLRVLDWRVAAFGIYMPLIGAASGFGLSAALGLSPGGATLLCVLGASASYIVVPAVIRVAIPEASPAISLTLALGITFPFNLIVGIPLYHEAVRRFLPVASQPASAAVTWSQAADHEAVAFQGEALQ
jgi:uncharacterized protein